MNKKVSIILPVYNGEKYIQKCLNSIINQTYNNLEIIVINDGSTDDTLKKIQQYKDDRLKIIDKKNTGVSNSRNLGIEKATGYYTTFIDADDWIDNNFIECMVKNIEQEKVDAVRCNFSIEKNNQSINQNLYELSNKKYIKNEFIEKKVLDHFLLLYKPITNYVMLLLTKTEIIKKIKFDESLYMMEDVLFYQELFNNINSIYFFDKCLYHYEDNNQSATRDVTKVEKNILGIISSGAKINQYLMENKITIDIKLVNTKQLNLIINFLNKLAQIGNYKKIKEILLKIYKLNDFKELINNVDLQKIAKFKQIIGYLMKKQNIEMIILFYKIRNIKKGIIK